MNTRTKVIVGAIVALFAISLIFRFVVLSQVGLAGGWVFYLGLPIGGIVALLLLLLRLGLLNFGESPSTAEAAQRLDELEVLRTKGAISDSEYAAQRARIICW